MMGFGLIHIYCGDGKGKTSAAIGAAIRAAGRGKRVLLARFMKTEDSGELAALAQVPLITVLPDGEGFGFSWNMTDARRKAASDSYAGKLSMAWELAVGESEENAYDMLILDEVIGTCSLGFIREESLLAALRDKPQGLEVILTGRGPSEQLLEMADYVTEMTMVKHPYEHGVGARKGIEY